MLYAEMVAAVNVLKAREGEYTYATTVAAHTGWDVDKARSILLELASLYDDITVKFIATCDTCGCDREYAVDAKSRIGQCSHCKTPISMNETYLSYHYIRE